MSRLASVDYREVCIVNQLNKQENVREESGFTCPRYEGSVKLSVYPTMPVENTTSPLTGFSAPKDIPSNTLPSSRVIFAFTTLSLLSDPLTVFTRRRAEDSLVLNGSLTDLTERATLNRRNMPALASRLVIFRAKNKQRNLEYLNEESMILLFLQHLTTAGIQTQTLTSTCI